MSYRLNVRKLPGSPDFANQRRGWALFVNGCFWHGHKNCPLNRKGQGSQLPDNNKEFWKAKFQDNRRRDAQKVRGLRKIGLRVLIVWECQLKRESEVIARLTTLARMKKGGSQ
jgi:DNA mismatch endonuclease Vsr